MLSTPKIHIAICTEPFLSLMLSGRKKVESRFSKKKIAPYEKVSRGDVVLLKKSGGAIMGFCKVQKVAYFEIENKKTFTELQKEYHKIICAEVDKDFWDTRASSKYASFIWLGKINFLKDVSIHKAGRSGWRIIDPYEQNQAFYRNFWEN